MPQWTWSLNWNEITRAIVVGSCPLHWVGGYPLDGALRLLQAHRPEICPNMDAYHGCRADLVAACRERIERRAFELYGGGANVSAVDDWNQAAEEILREILAPELRGETTLYA